jgi:hypothetical protein
VFRGLVQRGVGELLDLGVCQWWGKVCGERWDVRGMCNMVQHGGALRVVQRGVGDAARGVGGSEACAAAQRASGVGGTADPGGVSVAEQARGSPMGLMQWGIEGGIVGRGAGGAGVGGAGCRSWRWCGMRSGELVLVRCSSRW